MHFFGWSWIMNYDLRRHILLWSNKKCGIKSLNLYLLRMAHNLKIGEYVPPSIEYHQAILLLAFSLFSRSYRKILKVRMSTSYCFRLKGEFMILIDFFFKGPTESAPREKNRGTTEKGLSWCVLKLLCWRLHYNSAKWPKSTLCVMF